MSVGPAGHIIHPPDLANDSAMARTHPPPPPPALPLHKLLTLPLALHIPPIPTLHYQAVPSQAADDERSIDDDGQSDSLQITSPHTSLIGNNLRLQPLVLQPPPHDLDTISFLLDKSRATHAIPPLVDLLALLDAADDDPHFRNLCDFFDARYDLETGTLVGLDSQENGTSAPVRPSRKPRQSSGMLTKMVSLSRKARVGSSSTDGGPPSLHPRSASSSLGQSGGSLLSSFRSGRHRSPSVFSDEGRTWSGTDIDDLTDAMSSSDLDIISEQVHGQEQGKPPRQAPHLLVPLKSSPNASRSVAFPVRLDLHNAAKGLCEPPPPKRAGLRTSGNPGMTALNRVASPNSVRSNGSRYSSSRSRSSSEHRAQEQTQEESHSHPQLHSHSQSQSPPRRAPVRRRSSALQRFLGLNKTSAKARRRTRESSMGSVEYEDSIDEDAQSVAVVGSDDDEAGIDAFDHAGVPPVPPIPAHLAGEAFAQTPPAPPSLGSMGVVAASSTTGDAAMPSVAGAEASTSARSTWAGTRTDGPPGDDFLTLLRSVAQTALSLPDVAAPSAPSPTLSDKARGKQRDDTHGSPESPFDEAPPSPSDDVFSRRLRGEASAEKEPWWPSGGVDPLPVAICSALGVYFGWDGIMRLCYGPGSPLIARSGEENGGVPPSTAAQDLAALGRAAAEARRAQAGKEGEEEDVTGAAGDGAEEKPTHRTWADWHRVLTSMSQWVELYEMTRVRGGLAREVGLDAEDVDGERAAPLASQDQYSLSSGTIPSAVSRDASNRQTHPYRRRLGIPEGLPANEDGIELGDYRWSRNRLGPASVATSMTITASSLAHVFKAMSTTDITYAASWELDYLEALALKSPVIAIRFPPPISRPVTAVSHPFDDSGESQEVASARARPTPHPAVEGHLDADEWERWAGSLLPGQIITPVVSLQAWWAVIALINSEQKQDVALQILSMEEDWKTIRAEERQEGADGSRNVWI